MIYVKVNDDLYPATIDGRLSDRDWDNRECKLITMDGDYASVDALFVDGASWSIVDEERTPSIDVDSDGKTAPVLDENGEQVYDIAQTEYDNSDFYIRGDLTVHTDGTCTVKMGKPTDLEDAYEILYGGM